MRMTSLHSHSARRSLCSLIAVVALLGQVVVPHVHGRADRSDATRGTLAACATVDCSVWTADASPSEHDGHQHGPNCTFCRAQSDARSLLVPAALAMPVPGGTMSRLGRALAPPLHAARRSLAAPRAPPAAS